MGAGAAAARPRNRHMKPRHLFAWIGAGVAATVLLVWTFPRLFPFFPGSWEVSRAEALAIAQERFRDLERPLVDPHFVVVLNADNSLEQRMEEVAPTRRDRERLAATAVARRLIQWVVTAYPAGALDTDWTHRASITLDGEVTELQLRMLSEESAGAIEAGEARRAAEAFLVEQGFDLSGYAAPEIRSRDREARTDHAIRFASREAALGPEVPYGVEVTFAGDRLTGFRAFLDDPGARDLRRKLQTVALLEQAWLLIPLPLSLVVAVFFLRRYHAGVVGVRRSLQICLLVLGALTLFIFLSKSAASAGWSTGIFTRRLIEWIAFVQLILIFFFPVALLSALSWSVGESICRERWGHKLAAFDALFQGRWANATVARASLRGVVGGLGLAAVLQLCGVALREAGAHAQAGWLLGPWWGAAKWPGIALFAFGVAFTLYYELFGRLLLVPPTTRRWGTVAGGVVAAVATSLVFWPSLIVLPVEASLPFWVLAQGALVFLFLRYGLLTSLLASLTLFVARPAMPLLLAGDATIQFQGLLALAGAALPLIASVRHLGSDREFIYRWEDVPPHVRRIAERERQKVELETARNIQSSILPELPPELHGVRIAHCYLPATEVGGDFYDVMALEDGRLAVAVGDVAGHGVSSGLVMSMAKSALAVQVTFNPGVEEVFATLNRMVYQSARRRLLTTLCYVLIDPRAREMQYASAGHLFPYRISRHGAVGALESISYPLGVRDRIAVTVRNARLESGDNLFLFSDGVIETRRDGSEELFGFERLEQSLRRHSAAGVGGLRDGVLADLEAFGGRGPRADDLTLLVLQLP